MLALRPCRDEKVKDFKRLEEEHRAGKHTHSKGDTMRLIGKEDG